MSVSDAKNLKVWCQESTTIAGWLPNLLRFDLPRIFLSDRIYYINSARVKRIRISFESSIGMYPTSKTEAEGAFLFERTLI
jgi:hypothetical protein